MFLIPGFYNNMDRSSGCSLLLPPPDISVGTEGEYEYIFEDGTACCTTGSGCWNKGKTNRGERFAYEPGMVLCKSSVPLCSFKIGFPL